MINLSVEELEAGVIIISVVGEFRIEMINRVEQVWNEQLQKKPRVIAFNCQEMAYIDSSSIGSLVKFVNSAKNKKIDLVIYGLNKDVFKIFHTARLNNFFGIMSKTEFEIKHLKKRLV
jgi:anti-sigma B factor antagonist